MGLTFAQRVIDYHLSLNPEITLPEEVDWIKPFDVPETRHVFAQFFSKYYPDHNRRVFLFGINPGRFGAGITGVPFTDPIRLEEACGISNTFKKRQELSSVFVYDLINKLGGVKRFYRHFYITSLCPLGFLKEQKNYNYYDDKTLWQLVEPFIVHNIKTQIAFGADRSVAYSLGKGKNFAYFKKLNDQFKFFEEVRPLPHPRWVMQYRLKLKEEILESMTTELRPFLKYS